jgi:hypothetical protein
MNRRWAAEPSHASTLRCFRLFGLDDFEVWRRRVTRLLIFTSALLMAYWAAWFADRGIVAGAITRRSTSPSSSRSRSRMSGYWELVSSLVRLIHIDSR